MDSLNSDEIWIAHLHGPGANSAQEKTIATSRNIEYVEPIIYSIRTTPQAPGYRQLSDNDKEHVLTRRGERRVFLFIAVFLFPILSVIFVGGYGFLIWMYQLIFGPPGPS